MKLQRSVSAILILLGILIAPITFIPLVNAQGGQVTLNPTDDTHTDWWNDETNYGGSTSLYVTMNENARFVWLKFDLTDVPDGAIVTSATLELYCWFVSETFNVSAHFCVDNTWTELAITHYNQPDYNETAMSWVLIGSPDQWYSWDVAYAINQTIDGWYGGEDVVTIVLQENWDHEYANAYFSSKESGSYIPKLTVEWSDIIPEFPTWMSMALVLTIVTIVIIIYKRRLLKTPIH